MPSSFVGSAALTNEASNAWYGNLYGRELQRAAAKILRESEFSANGYAHFSDECVKILSHLDIGWNTKNDFVGEFPIVECLANELICLPRVNRDLTFNETAVSKFEVDPGSRTLKSTLADVFQMQ